MTHALLLRVGVVARRLAAIEEGVRVFVVFKEVSRCVRHQNLLLGQLVVGEHRGHHTLT